MSTFYFMYICIFFSRETDFFYDSCRSFSLMNTSPCVNGVLWSTRGEIIIKKNVTMISVFFMSLIIKSACVVFKEMVFLN